MKRKHALLVTYGLLLAAEIALAYVAKNDNLEPPGSRSGPSWWQALQYAVWALLLIQGLRGSRDSLTVLASLEGLFGVGAVVASFFVPNGAFQLASVGLTELASALVLVLLRDEIQAERRTPEPLRVP